MTYSLRRILTPSSLGGKRIPSRIFPPSTVSFKILSFPSRCNPYPISSSTTGAPTENYIFRSTLPFGTNKRYFSTNDEPKHTVSIPEKHITAFILENATSFGKKPALINSTDGKMVLYEDLPKRVHYAMNHLRSKGVKKGTVVGIHMPNSPEYVIAWQAIAALGGIATTSNPQYTVHELSHQFTDSQATYCITTVPFRDTVIAAAGALTHGKWKEVFVIGEDSGSFLTQIPVDSPSHKITSATLIKELTPVNPKTDLLVLPYSSGTTGLPKGVMLTHYNLVANVIQCMGTGGINLGMQKSDVVAGVLPLFHIYGMTVVNLVALELGATVLTFPNFNPQQFLQAIQQYKASYLPIVPPIINFLARHPLINQFNLASIRLIFSGAAPLDAETQRVTAKRLNSIVAQGYGLTELSPVSHINDPQNSIPGSIGKSVVNSVCHIFDPETNQRINGYGPNHTGELRIKGPNVMQGYLNNPKATENTLVNGYCCTGDIGYQDENGDFFIVDRLKELIKVKGFQCAPAELEGILLSHPAVMDAAVVGKPDERSGEIPIAFVVSKQRGLELAGHPDAAKTAPTATGDELRQYVDSRVAHYKHLGEVRFVDAIPKSASGKILRRVLKATLVGK